MFDHKQLVARALHTEAEDLRGFLFTGAKPGLEGMCRC